MPMRTPTAWGYTSSNESGLGSAGPGDDCTGRIVGSICIGIATNKPALDIQRSVGLKRLLAKGKVRKRNELVVARLGVVEHQAVGIELRHVQSVRRQNAAQDIVGQIRLDIEVGAVTLPRLTPASIAKITSSRARVMAT